MAKNQKNHKAGKNQNSETTTQETTTQETTTQETTTQETTTQETTTQETTTQETKPEQKPETTKPGNKEKRLRFFETFKGKTITEDEYKILNETLAKTGISLNRFYLMDRNGNTFRIGRKQKGYKEIISEQTITI